MNRRRFLKRATQLAGLGAIAWSGGGLPMAHASSGDRVLVVVFLRGGWDGMNVSVPYGDDAYYALRPNIAIRPPSDGTATSALDLDGFFGLHPALSELHGMYQSGQVAVLPTVHYTGASQSHFLNQDVIESGAAPAVSNGWLARYLMQLPGDTTGKGIGLSDQVPFSLMGLPIPVSAYPDLANLYMAGSQSDRTMLANVFSQGYSWGAPPGNPYSEALKGIGGKLFADLSALQVIGQTPPENGAVYPSTAFGRQIRQAAALVKVRAGLELITLNLGGWDTHSAQGGANGRMAVQLSDLSKSVSAFFTDLGAAAGRVTVLAVTEFGRTAAENSSGGTDHGNASTWLAIGPNVRGGVHLGSGWPGLQTSQLFNGRYLAHTVDFRSIYANVLSRCLGVTNIAAVLPGYSGAMVDVVA